jgi:hypothetical protein
MKMKSGVWQRNDAGMYSSDQVRGCVGNKDGVGGSRAVCMTVTVTVTVTVTIPQL